MMGTCKATERAFLQGGELGAMQDMSKLATKDDLQELRNDVSSMIGVPTLRGTKKSLIAVVTEKCDMMTTVLLQEIRSLKMLRSPIKQGLGQAPVG